MAHLWSWSDDSQWQAFPLNGDRWALSATGAPEPLPPGDITGDDGRLVVLRRAPGPHDERWLLMASERASVLVNGLPMAHGIAALVDRDEIRVPPLVPAFFSTERAAHVAPYPADGPRGFCPRCKRPLAAGDPAVRCPGCGLWHHALDHRPCWTHSDRCAACPHPTALDAGFQWTPEEL